MNVNRLAKRLLRMVARRLSRAGGSASPRRPGAAGNKPATHSHGKRLRQALRLIRRLR